MTTTDNQMQKWWHTAAVIDETDERVQYIMRKDPILGEYIKKCGQIEYYLCHDFNRFVIGTIIGQLISFKVAMHIYNKFEKACWGDFSHENILKLSRDELRAMGMNYRKADYILYFMQTLKEDKNYINRIEKMGDRDAMRELTKLHGIGNWSAKMLLMFYFDRQDFVPVEDLAFMKGYNALYKCDKKPKQVLEDCKKWSPYSSVASRYVYAYADEIFGNVPKF